MVHGHGSFIGPESDSVSVYTVELISDADLIRYVENLKKQIRILRLENEVLEASIMRLQPSLMTGAYSALEYAKRLSTLSMEGTSRSRFALTDYGQSSINIKSQTRSFHRKVEPSVRASTVKMSRSIISGAGPKINIEEMLELIHAIMENQGNELKKFKSAAMKQTDLLKAQLEEVTLRTIDFEKWTQDFEKEVVIDGVEMMTKRIPAETWIRFMTEHDKKIDRQIDKLRLRTSTANTQHRKLREDIKRKKDWVSRIVPVDFEVKTIEITKALRVIEQKNKNVFGMKALAGDANLNLTIHKYDLMNTMNYLKKVQNLKVLREIQTAKLNDERASLEERIRILEQNLNWIQEQRKAYYVPDVLEYVRVKFEMSELNNSIKRLETRLNIKQCALSSFKKNNQQSSIFVNKKIVKRSREYTVDSDVCEPLVVTVFEAPKKICSPCGLIPRD